MRDAVVRFVISLISLEFIILGLICRYVPARSLQKFGYLARNYKKIREVNISIEQKSSYYRRVGLFFIVMGMLNIILINRGYIQTFFTK